MAGHEAILCQEELSNGRSGHDPGTVHAIQWTLFHNELGASE